MGSGNYQRLISGEFPPSLEQMHREGVPASPQDDISKEHETMMTEVDTRVAEDMKELNAWIADILRTDE